MDRRLTDHQTALLEAAEDAHENGHHELAEELELLTIQEQVEQEEKATSPFNDAGQLLSEVEPDEIDWLWEHWLQLQTVTILVGAADTGKSTFTSDLIARVTRGDVMPDGTPCLAPGGAVIISLEESTAKTVVPRLRAAGADLTRVIDLSKVKRTVRSSGDPVRSPFMLPDDLPILEKAIKRVNASIVVIDPLMSVVNPRISTFRNQSARQIVTTFADYAERLGVAVLIVNHYTKGNAKDPMQAMAGSKGFSDVVRSLWTLGRDGSNPSQRVLSLYKHNNAPDRPQIVLVHDGKQVVYLDGVTEAQAKVNEQQQLSQGRASVLSIVRAHPDREYTPTEIAQTVGLHYDTAKSLLRRMAQDGQLERTQHGLYRLPTSKPAPLPAPSAPVPVKKPAPDAPHPVPVAPKPRKVTNVAAKSEGVATKK